MFLHDYRLSAFTLSRPKNLLASTIKIYILFPHIKCPTIDVKNGIIIQAYDVLKLMGHGSFVAVSNSDVRK